MKKPLYATEADLCADFITWVKKEAGTKVNGVTVPLWTPYAETAGWDILLVAEDGTQIGVQAKLKFNMKVLQQAVPQGWRAWHDEGPDYRAILIGDRDTSRDALCAALGLTLFSPLSDYRGYMQFDPCLSMHRYDGGWHYWSPTKRCELPEFVPDVIAGASGPVQLTKWKIAALRVVAMLEVRGHVTRHDFKTIGIDHRRWTGPGGWIVADGSPGRFIRGPGLDFDAQHPDVYAEVLAETRQKLAAEAAPPPAIPAQGSGALFTETAA